MLTYVYLIFSEKCFSVCSILQKNIQTQSTFIERWVDTPEIVTKHRRSKNNIEIFVVFI